MSTAILTCFSSFTSTGYPFGMSSSTFTRYFFSISLHISVIIPSMSFLAFSSKVRTVPLIFTLSGMILVAPLAVKLPMPSTSGSSVLYSFAASFSFITSSLPIRTWSLLFSGSAACPPRPFMLICSSSAEAIYLPPLNPVMPEGRSGSTCWAIIRSGRISLKVPVSISFFAPPGACSSPGWKIKTILPANSFLRSLLIFIADISIAIWLS